MKKVNSERERKRICEPCYRGTKQEKVVCTIRNYSNGSRKVKVQFLKISLQQATGKRENIVFEDKVVIGTRKQAFPGLEYQFGLHYSLEESFFC